MSQQETPQQGGLQAVLSTFERILPAFLDYRAGRNPNVVYGQDGIPAYAFGPTGDPAADRARAEALYGRGSLGAMPIGTLLLIGVGMYFVLKGA